MQPAFWLVRGPACGNLSRTPVDGLVLFGPRGSRCYRRDRYSTAMVLSSTSGVRSNQALESEPSRREACEIGCRRRDEARLSGSEEAKSLLHQDDAKWRVWWL